MRKMILALTMAVSVLALSACSDKEAANNEDILATTKAGDITKTDLYDEMQESIGVQVFQNLALKKAIENEYKISEKELKDTIKEQKDTIGDKNAFELYLEQNNLTEDMFEKQAEFSLLQQKLIGSLEEVTDEQIAEEYKNMKKEIHARHILLEDKETAEEVIAKINDGGDFAELAKEHSIEPIAHESGGDLGWFTVGKMVQEFDDAVFALEEKVISEPIKTSFGYHVIEVLESREADLEGTLEELSPEIENRFKEELFNEKLAVLVKNAEIDIKADLFKDALDAYKVSEEK